MQNNHSCSGNCSGCSGCARELTLNEGELRLLDTLCEIPFLPVARKMGDDTPVYLEEQEYSPEEYSLILSLLEKRGLISIDYDKPLRGGYSALYDPYPVRGSFALTARGQQVLELMQIHGIE